MKIRRSNMVLPDRNTLLSELKDVVKALNSKFVSLALPRNDKVSTIVSDIAENEHSFFLHLLGMVELELYVADLKDGKSSGLDELSAKLWSLVLQISENPFCICSIAPWVKVFFQNASRGLKLSHSMKWLKMNIDKHRLISILPVLSTMLEKVLYARLESFFLKFNISTRSSAAFDQNTQLSTL